MSAIDATAIVASFTVTLPNTSFTFSLVMMNGNFDVSIFPSRGGGRTRRDRRLVNWGRGVCLLSRGLNNPVTAVLRFMWLEREVRLLRVVAMMVVMMRSALNRVVIGSTIAIVVKVRGPPYLPLLGSSGPFILVDEAMRLVSSLSWPLLLLVGKHSCTLISKVAVVALPTHVVMWVMATSLCSNWWWSLI